MEGETFDELVKRLTQTRLSRFDALRGVLASAVVGLTGATRAAETAARSGPRARARARGKEEGEAPRPGPSAAQGHALP